MKNILFALTLIAFISTLNAQSDTALVLSEIMFNPLSGNNEFVEIYNRSETQSFDLSSYKIIYYTSNADVIISAGFGTVLPPKSYAVILEGDYDFATGIYSSLIPANAIKLKISDNSFGTSGMANTTNRPVWFVSTANDTLDRCTYSANNGTGYSDEKIRMNRDSLPSNWANSQAQNGSPGFRNSVTPLNYDLRIKSLANIPQNPIQGQNVQIVSTISNSGILTAASYTIEIFNDINFDSTGSSSEIIYSQLFSNLSAGDSVSVNAVLPSITPGNYQIISKVSFSLDEDSTNNKKIIRFTALPPGNNYNDIAINEIMYAPLSNEPEWVEVFNRSSSAKNLKKWKLGDNAASTVITNNDVFIQPASYLVLSKDSSITNYFPNVSSFIVFNLPALNNTGDAVVLKDSLSVLIDSLSYMPDWGGSSGGKSLERISVNFSSILKANWGTSQSIFRATPGNINSITQKDNDLKISSFKNKNSYTIIGEPAEFEIKIINKGLNASSNYLVNLFNDVNKDSIPQTGELLGQVNGTSLASADSSLLLFSTNNFLQGKNYFIAKLEVNPDDDSTNNISFTNFFGAVVNEIRNDIVINEIMYAPNSPEPEWIEIFNRSTKVVDLKNYKVADNADTITAVLNSTILNPGEYFLITTDTTIKKYYNVLSRLAVANIPSLNNSGDKLILLDSLNRTIDSLQYFSSWGGSNGKSLERISVSQSATDSSNWKTSKSKYKATPGYINSVSAKSFDVQTSDIIYNPAFPFFGNNITISAKVKNNGSNSVIFNLKLWEDANLDSLPDAVVSSLDNVNLLPGDSTNVQFNFAINNLQNEKGFYAVAEQAQDQDTSNNYFYKRVTPGFPPSTILINEIMYSPINGEPEWIEIVNTSTDSINLKNWSVSDVLTTPIAAKISEEHFLREKSFLILAKDTTIQLFHRVIPSRVIKLNLPNLNNDVDGVVLRDNRNVTIDSIKYFSDWGGTGGKSLERISLSAASNLPANWNSSIDIELSTPGRINSITPKQFDLSIAGISFEPRFPVSGENVLMNAKVKNNGSAAANNFSVEFYIDTDSNSVVDQLVSMLTGLTLAAGDSSFYISSSAIPNLRSKILTAVRIVFAGDEDTLNNYAEKSVEPGFPEKSILINEVMYTPTSGEPEWIELVNVSNKVIDIKNWSVSDVLTTPTKVFITNSTEEVLPGEYFVIARDTSFYNFHSPVNYKVKLVNFGTLGNTEDGIIIYDFRNGIIDSFSYNSTFGGKNGFSLERISFTEPTNSIGNWITSLSTGKSTPGEINSIFNIPVYEKNDLVINEIMFDPDIDNSEFIEFINLSNDSLNVGGWQIEDENKNSFKVSATSLIVPPNQYFLLTADSAAISKYNLQNYPYKNIAGESSLGLINTGELILLKDARGNTIDSIWYSDKWHNKNFISTKNISLERINPSLNGNDSKNWNSCVNSNGATPGIQNSIFTDNKNRANNISVSPNPFSPDNDGFEDYTIINYSLGQQTSQVRIKIFDSKGRLVRTLTNNQPSGSSGSIVFNGIGDDGAALRIGIYIIFLEALNETEGVVEILKTTVVVARKL